jgi:hypothetical protein
MNSIPASALLAVLTPEAVLVPFVQDKRLRDSVAGR